MASEPLVWACLLRSWWYEGQRLHFSSPFHENIVVVQHTSAGLFHHRKTARAPTQETSTLACLQCCGVGLFACRSRCSEFSFWFFAFAPDGLCTPQGESLQLVSKQKPTENSPQIHHLFVAPSSLYVVWYASVFFCLYGACSIRPVSLGC